MFIKTTFCKLNLYFGIDSCELTHKNYDYGTVKYYQDIIAINKTSFLGKFPLP